MTGFAIVGTGRVAKQIADAIDKAPGAETVAVVSRSLETGAKFAEGHGTPTIYDDLHEMLADAAVDAVYISSPNSLHRDQVVAAARAGKHILCEKPMALDPQQCLEMIDAAESNGVRLVLGFQFRQHPAHSLMRDTVASGELGDGRFADASVYISDGTTPDWYNDTTLSAASGVLSMAGVHRIDLLRFITGGEVEEVSAFVESRAGRAFDDEVTAMLKFDTGVIATMRFGLGVPRGGDPLTIYGTAGRVSGIQTMAQWWSDTGGEVLIDLAGEVTSHPFDQPDLYRSQIENFLRAIEGDTSGVALGVDGLRGVEIAQAIYEAASNKKTVTVVRH